MTMICNWLRYLLRREQWVRHPEDGTWHNGGALIEERNDGSFWLWRDCRGATRHASLREAIDAEATDK
ncbi:hypothetical protein [Paracoccus hibiscisoli]|uniref:Uncharacterized protein n=1 Tax=Paracoccus hibiscisoli TaxID=2023261 RepID=A0A4U0QVS0_9RHOB|nr:hypothetical protein [Paracoccus hibiscisoli]TJZ86136.1 hypothetical protein FA740_04410 [Paracoccus hibiscisoli]